MFQFFLTTKISTKNMKINIYMYLNMKSFSFFPNTPGPRESCGHAVLPSLWHGGWPHLSLWLSGCLQRSLAPGAEAGPLLWDIQARRPHLHLQHHDARDGVRRSHWRERISCFLQCREATYGRFGHLLNLCNFIFLHYHSWRFDSFT